jgi:hypothetical protein
MKILQDIKMRRGYPRPRTFAGRWIMLQSCNEILHLSFWTRVLELWLKARCFLLGGHIFLADRWCLEGHHSPGEWNVGCTRCTHLVMVQDKEGV